MNMKRKTIQFGLGLAVLGLSAALPAASATTESPLNWAVWEGQEAAAPRVIYTEGTEKTGALLVCDQHGSMRALLMLEPGSIPKLMKRQAAYARSSDAVITVGDGAPTNAKFRYTPATKSVETKANHIAAKVFNAAVLGETLTVKLQREGTIETNLPAPNEAFKAFATTCQGLRTAQED